LFEYACHEGNYAMRGILAGARAAEKAAEQTAGKQPRWPAAAHGFTAPGFDLSFRGRLRPL